MILDYIDKWCKRLFVGAELRPYETVCLEAWKQRLADKLRLALEDQLDYFDYVERLAEAKKVNFWYLDAETGPWPGELLFLTGDEGRATVAATVWLRKKEPRSRARLRADITVYRGRFFSIDFDKPPLAFFGIDKKSAEVPIVDEIIIRDDLTHGTAPPAPLADVGRLEGWLAEWHSRRQLFDVLEPPAEAEREELLHSFDTVFPKDYLEAVEQVGGFRVGNCRLYGLAMVEKVVHPDRNFYAIAEVENRAYIGVRQGAKTVEIFELHFEFEVPQRYKSTSIQAVLERELEASDD